MRANDKGVSSLRLLATGDWRRFWLLATGDWRRFWLLATDDRRRCWLRTTDDGIRTTVLVRWCLLLSVVMCAACVAPQSAAPRPSATPLWEQAEVYAAQAEYGKDRQVRLASAKAGRRIADACVDQHPSRTACYYYRAVLTGLYYQMTVVGYQDGVQQMVADSQKILAIDPQFAEAGAYRILGQLYTELPPMTFLRDHLRRDLPHARELLNHAVTLAPTSVANHLALCETLTRMDAWEDAYAACARAETLLQQTQKGNDFTTWRAQLQDLKKRLARRGGRSMRSEAARGGKSGDG